MNKRLLLFAFCILSVLLACRFGNPEAAQEAATQAPAVTLASSSNEPAKALQTVTFTAQIPENTPTEDKIYLLIMPLSNWDWLQHVAMTPNADGSYSATVELEQGALVRYAYDRWDENDWARFRETREAFNSAVLIQNRYLSMSAERETVNDRIAAWADLSESEGGPTGTLTGQITDDASGEPIMDANLSIAGIHTASDYDGRFEIRGLPAGAQRLTVYTTLGNYHMADSEVEIPANGEAELNLSLQAAQLVRVSFEAALPEDTPEEAEIKLVGNIYQLGARLGHPAVPNQPDNHVLPVVPRSQRGDIATLRLYLYEGTYVQYYYTLAAVGSAFERSAEGSAVYRSFVVGEGGTTREDQVAAWRMPDESLITLRVFTPPNTTPGAPLLMQAGPTERMTQVGEYEWITYVTRFPGQEFRFRFLQGDDTVAIGGALLGQDVSPGTDDGWRTLVAGDEDEEIQITIEEWFGNVAADWPDYYEDVNVTFNVSLPPNTPLDDEIRLFSHDQPSLTPAMALTRDPNNPWMASITVPMPAGENLVYGYHTSSGLDVRRIFSIDILHEGQVINDWIERWDGAPSAAYGDRPDYITGFYIPDYWTGAFDGTLSETLERIAEHNGGWVALSSVWHYGSFNPPIVEPRPVWAPSVLSLKEQIADQAAAAHAAGLKIFLSPQFNLEMVEGGGDAICSAHTDAWWMSWVRQAERLWLWNAELAQEIGAEMLSLPGNCFHAFPPRSFFETEAGADAFDAAISDLVGRVRAVYDGLILIPGGTDFAFPGLADINGETTYGTGFPDLPASASVDEWTAAWDALFQTTLDEIYARHGRLLIFYSIHTPVEASTGDPYGELAQAHILEGAFRALSTREWFAGSFTWAYELITAPDKLDAGLRGRLGEAVLAKWYGIFTGE